MVYIILVLYQYIYNHLFQYFILIEWNVVKKGNGKLKWGDPYFRHWMSPRDVEPRSEENLSISQIPIFMISSRIFFNFFLITLATEVIQWNDYIN